MRAPFAVAVMLASACAPAALDPLALPGVSELNDVADLPPLFTSYDGTERVEQADQWRDWRRGELTTLLSHYVYGALPKGPHAVSVELVAEAAGVVPGGDYAEYRATIDTAPDRPLYLAVFRPAGATNPPVFLGLNKCGNQSLLADARIRATSSHVIAACDAARGSQAALWPVEEIIAAGHALVTFHESDAAPDDDGHAREAFLSIYRFSTPRPSQWGALSAWAFGLHRALDALANVPSLDQAQVTLVGHSRRGKAALWAAALDERVTRVVAHQSGRGGAPLTRGGTGESLEILNAAFPHWFNHVFPDFVGEENRLPVNQHQLVALVAPRGVMLSEGDDDGWADPPGSRASLLAADPAWKLLGASGATEVAGGELDPSAPLTWRHRPGGHAIGKDDWLAFIAWVDAHRR